MLKELNCSEAQLKVAAAFSGQDHITGVSGFGIKKTLDRIRNITSPIPNVVFDTAIKRMRKKLRSQGETAKEEAQFVINHFLNGTTPITPEFNEQFLQEMGQDEDSVMKKFLNETKVNEANEIVFRRPGLQDYVQEEQQNREDPDWVRVPCKRSSTKNHQEHLEKQRHSRLESVKNRVQNKSFPFRFNIYTVLEVDNYATENQEQDSDSDGSDDEKDDESDDSGDDESDEEECGSSVKVANKRRKKAVSGQGSQQSSIEQPLASGSGQGSHQSSIDQTSPPKVDEEVNLRDFKYQNKSLYQRRARDLGKFENTLSPSLKEDQKDRKFADHVIYSIKQIKVKLL